MYSSLVKSMLAFLTPTIHATLHLLMSHSLSHEVQFLFVVLLGSSSTSLS